MTKTLILFFLLLFCFKGLSQTEFAAVGTKWEYTIGNNSGWLETTYSLLESRKDTLINGRNCKIISSLNITRYDNPYFRIAKPFYDEKAYILNIQNDSLFTFKYNQFTFQYKTKYALNDSIVSKARDKYIVSKIDSITISSGQKYKRYKFTGLCQNIEQRSFYFIENIGFTENGLFHINLPCLIDGSSYSLCSYYYKDVNYKRYENCKQYYEYNLNFASVGTKWIYRFTGLGGYGSVKYESIADTIIENKNCRKIKSTRILNTGPTGQSRIISESNSFYYTKSDSIFTYSNDQFIYILHFNLSLNDTLSTINPNIKYFVSKIEKINIGEVVNKYTITDSCFGRKHNYTAIANIGVLEDPIFFIPICTDLKEITHMLCYFESGKLSYGDKTFCESLVINDEINDNIGFEIYPSVVQNMLNIKSSIDFKNISITNIHGKILKSTPYTEGVSLDVSNLPNGLYILQLIDNQGKRAVKKFVKM